MQQLRDKLAVADRTAKSEAQLKVFVIHYYPHIAVSRYLLETAQR